MGKYSTAAAVHDRQDNDKTGHQSQENETAQDTAAGSRMFASRLPDADA